MVDRKSNGTKSVEDLPRRLRRHVTTRKHDCDIRITHLSDIHPTSHATVRHILEQSNGLVRPNYRDEDVKNFEQIRIKINNSAIN